MDGEENEQIGVGEDWVCFDVEKELNACPLTCVSKR